MTRITSFGLKRKDMLPSASVPTPTPASATASAAQEETAEPVPKKRKVHRGTRGKNDKRNRKLPNEGEAEGEGAAPVASVDGTTGPLPTSSAVNAEQNSKVSLGKKIPLGTKTMAGLKGPKPGESIEEHAARMERKKSRKDSRQTRSFPLLSTFLFFSFLLGGSNLDDCRV